MDRITTKLLDMPKLGLGTWQLRGAEGQAAIEQALALGYRHIDTAEMYGNEEIVGAAIAASGVPRGEIFVTSKVWFDHLEPAAMRAACEASLARLGLGSVDLYLIHWPAQGMDLARSLAALDGLRQRRLARAIGVSNFPAGLLRAAIATGVPLACLQVEHHCLLGQEALRAICRAHGLALTSYSPLARGDLSGEPTLAAIARKHGASAAQVALAWLFAMQAVSAIPKAARRETQAANLAALRLALDAEDLASIAALPKDRRFVDPSFAPDWAA
jgi:2,5-diketo-D-gluconate reductase B